MSCYPHHYRRLSTKKLEYIEFAPSNPSGSFAQAALDTLLEQADWADGILLSGDFGHSSETAMLLEKFVAKTPQSLTLSQDSLDPFLNMPEVILHRQVTTLIPTVSQLQKITKSIHFPYALTSSTSLIQFVEALHELTTSYAANIVIAHQDSSVAAVNGQVSTTKILDASSSALAVRSTIWLLQNPTKPFEALTTANCRL